MTVNLILPLALLFLGLRGAKREASSSSGPVTPEGRALEAKLAVALAKKEAAHKHKHKSKPAPQPSAAPKTENDAAAQAAVNSAVTTAIKQQRAAIAADAPNAPGTHTPPGADEVKLATVLAKKEAELNKQQQPSKLRSPHDAAVALREFLARTHRFGSKKHPEEDIRAAQRDLNVKADGIVGPITRAAAKKAGVTLPAK